MKGVLTKTKAMRHVDSLEPDMEEKYYRSILFRQYPDAHTFIFRQGEIGDKFYVIFSGEGRRFLLLLVE